MASQAVGSPRSSRRQLITGSGACALAAGLSGCGIFSRHDPTGGDPNALKRTQVVPFSSSPADGKVPQGWVPSKLWMTKRRTHYETVPMDGTTVVNAASDLSASGIECTLGLAPGAARKIRWRWQAPALMPNSDIGIAGRDDCVARLAIALDGDNAKLGFRDMLFREQALLFAGMRLPFSTLLYVWDRVHPVGTVVCLRETSRIRYLVVESGDAALGRWVDYERDLHDDMQRVFGEAPGKVIRAAISTDSNNTKTQAKATYGDISINAS